MVARKRLDGRDPWWTAKVAEAIAEKDIKAAMEKCRQISESAIEHATFNWNYTTWLDLAAIAVASWLLFLKLSRNRHAVGGEL